MLSFSSPFDLCFFCVALGVFAVIQAMNKKDGSTFTKLDQRLLEIVTDHLSQNLWGTEMFQLALREKLKTEGVFKAAKEMMWYAIRTSQTRYASIVVVYVVTLFLHLSNFCLYVYVINCFVRFFVQLC